MLEDGSQRKGRPARGDGGLGGIPRTHLLDIVVVHEVAIAVGAIEVLIDHVFAIVLFPGEIVRASGTLPMLIVRVGVKEMTLGSHVLVARMIASKVCVASIALELRDLVACSLTVLPSGPRPSRKFLPASPAGKHRDKDIQKLSGMRLNCRGFVRADRRGLEVAKLKSVIILYEPPIRYG
jgi:hypothetical protein